MSSSADRVENDEGTEPVSGIEPQTRSLPDEKGQADRPTPGSSNLSSDVSTERVRLARWFLWSVIAICVAPFTLTLLGVDFSSKLTPLTPDIAAQLSQSELSEAIFSAGRGSYTHTILEWSACVVALMTVVLAFTHFRIKRDVVTPAIGMALFAAGIVDAFHTLAADRLIESTADPRNLIPFTWAISRTFNAVIPVTALGMLLFVRRYDTRSSQRRSFSLILGISAMIGALAWFVIQWCATSSNLPQTMFPDATITRPWDVYPLAVYVLSGVVIYPLFNKSVPSHFAHALWLSVLADGATQLHMALGSTALFDSHFNIAHFLKIVAYSIPCMGLIVDYVVTYNLAERATHNAAKRAEELSRSNSELSSFAYAAAHDLRSPLRAVDNLSQWALEDGGEDLSATVQEHLTALRIRVTRLDKLLDGLLEFATAGSHDTNQESLDSSQLVAGIVATLDVPSGFEVNVQSGMPTVVASRATLTQVFQNLISNAIKHHDGIVGRIGVSACKVDGGWVEFAVEDDGPGIPKEYRTRIFQMFQKLQRRDEVEGAGMGLALVQKRVVSVGGVVRVSDAKGRGTKFTFTWPEHPAPIDSM